MNDRGMGVWCVYVPRALLAVALPDICAIAGGCTVDETVFSGYWTGPEGLVRDDIRRVYVALQDDHVADLRAIVDVLCAGGEACVYVIGPDGRARVMGPSDS